MIVILNIFYIYKSLLLTDQIAASLIIFLQIMDYCITKDNGTINTKNAHKQHNTAVYEHLLFRDNGDNRKSLLIPAVLYSCEHTLIAYTRFDIKASKIVKSQTICVMLFVINLTRIQNFEAIAL